jgi:LacI family transcriptional regulator
VVIVDQAAAGDSYCSVAVDDVEGGRLAVTHLLERGHHRVAYVGGPRSVPQVRDRCNGALAAMAEAGLAAESLTVIETRALNVAEGRAAGQRLAGLPSSHRPTAAFCANDLLALGLLQEMTTIGISVPDQIAIVGYDDIEFAAAAAVPLTSVRQPRHLIGRTAMELLLAESQESEGDRADHVHRQVEFTPELVVRASSTGRRRSAAG